MCDVKIYNAGDEVSIHNGGILFQGGLSAHDPNIAPQKGSSNLPNISIITNNTESPQKQLSPLLTIRDDWKKYRDSCTYFDLTYIDPQAA